MPSQPCDAAYNAISRTYANTSYTTLCHKADCNESGRHRLQLADSSLSITQIDHSAISRMDKYRERGECALYRHSFGSIERLLWSVRASYVVEHGNSTIAYLHGYFSRNKSLIHTPYGLVESLSLGCFSM